MKKILFLTLTISLIFGLGFVANKTVAGEEECPAAPDVAGELLEKVGIDNRYGTGRDGGNYISDVARHMGPETDFEYPEGNIVSKCDIEAYKIAIALFLRSKGADVGADLFEAVLESVVYEGMCNEFGSHIDDKISFTFSNDVFYDSDVEVKFKTAQKLWEGWGADYWEFNGNTAIVTPNRLYGNPRNMVDDKVMDITGMLDAIDNPVVVPEGGVAITVDSWGVGIVDPETSGATWTDNQDGTGTMYITVKDYCGDGLGGLELADIEVGIQWVGLADLFTLGAGGYWDIYLDDKGNGYYEITFYRLGSVPYTRYWDVIVLNELIEENLFVNVSDVSATLEFVAYEGTCDTFGTGAGETLTFTFSNDVSLTETYPHVMFDGVGTIGTGPLNWSIESGNKVVITTTGEFNNPRPKIGDVVTGFNYIVDVIGNPVTVPDGGVEVVKVGGKCLVETVVVCSEKSTPTLSNIALEEGVNYELKAMGVADAGDTIDFDASYSITNRIDGDTWTNTVTGYELYGEELLGLHVDGVFPDWGDFNYDHIYYLDYVGTDDSVELWIWDIYYPNNVGSLIVEIYKVW